MVQLSAFVAALVVLSSPALASPLGAHSKRGGEYLVFSPFFEQADNSAPDHFRRPEPMSASETQFFLGARKTINTPVLFDTVNARISAGVGLAYWTGCTVYGAAQPAVNTAMMTGNLTMFENAVSTVVGTNNFMTFDEIDFAKPLGLWFPGKPIPKAKTYIIGNPIVAETMLVYDLLTGLHVPTRIALVEILDASGNSTGTTVVWDVPSTLMNIGALPLKTEASLLRATLQLDSNVENLVRNATGIWD
ncbi:hypothetical protein DL93DRAFT_2174139 [Clavulina sp. PMI_390]|nr:hypothetical protein DL93DRAFT_2174139 [Clavulina sp. PMI_390]